MITANDIMNYARTNGNEIEIESPQSYVRYGIFDQGSLNVHLAESVSEFRVGIRLKQNVWYWWKTYCLSTDDVNEMYDNRLMFDRRYNMANGAVQKSFRKGWKAEDQIMS